MQYELLFALCYLFEDANPNEPELADMNFRLLHIDSKGETVGTIDALHESVLETDPSGREMCP